MTEFMFTSYEFHYHHGVDNTFFNGFLILGLTDIKGKVLKGKMVLFDLETSDLD